jgi:hypothetical protein
MIPTVLGLVDEIGLMQVSLETASLLAFAAATLNSAKLKAKSIAV